MLNNLDSWLKYLETLHPKPIELGLARIREVAQRLNLIPVLVPVVTVGGTNGKGSCVTLTETIFLHAGYKVGAYTSPHLLKFNERIKINGIQATSDSICRAFEKIELARKDTTLTYFEFTTLAALLLFKENQLDVLVLEVGMGGRLDAVNIIDPDLAIISTVALDHMEWLGPDRDSIAREKAGIMRAHSPVVSGDYDTPAPIFHQAKNINAKLFCQTKDFSFEENALGWTWRSDSQTLECLPKPKIALQNAATVLMALELLSPKLPVPIESIKTALRTISVPGRFQMQNSTIFDVAHNPAAASLLSAQLKKLNPPGKVLAVIAMLSDKDQEGTIRFLLEQVDAWYVAGLTGIRGDSGKNLLDTLNKLGAQKVLHHQTVNHAYIAAKKDTAPEDVILVFGSFHTVAEAMEVAL